MNINLDTTVGELLAEADKEGDSSMIQAVGHDEDGNMTGAVIVVLGKHTKRFVEATRDLDRQLNLPMN